MTFHIGYDREEDKIELILASQGNVISTLKTFSLQSSSRHRVWETFYSSRVVIRGRKGDFYYGVL